MTPCRQMRTVCARAGTSPRAAWWASWSMRLSCSARSVCAKGRGPPCGRAPWPGRCSPSAEPGARVRGGVGWPRIDFDSCLSSPGSWESFHRCGILVFVPSSLAGQQLRCIISILTGSKLGCREVQWLTPGYTANDKACSHALVFPLMEKNIRAEPLGGERRKRSTVFLSGNWVIPRFVTEPDQLRESWGLKPLQFPPFL